MVREVDCFSNVHAPANALVMCCHQVVLVMHFCHMHGSATATSESVAKQHSMLAASKLNRNEAA